MYAIRSYYEVLSSSSVSVSEDVQSFFNTLVYLKGIPTAMVMSVGLVETILIQACLFLGFVVILNYILFPVVRFLKSMLRMHFGMQSKELVITSYSIHYTKLYEYLIHIVGAK